MTREIAEAIADHVKRPSPVLSLEDGRVWVSGMNARCWSLAREVHFAVTALGYDAEKPTDDGAAEHGGLIVRAPECEPISDEVHEEVFGDAE